MCGEFLCQLMLSVSPTSLTSYFQHVSTVRTMMWWQVALGLGLDGLPAVNSTGGSRLWKWSGRVYADDAAHTTSTSNDAVPPMSQNYGICSS